MRFIAPGKSVFSKNRVFADCHISAVTLFMFALADGDRGSLSIFLDNISLFGVTMIKNTLITLVKADYFFVHLLS